MTYTVFSDTDTIDAPRLERDDKAPKLPIWFDKPEPRSFQPKMKLRTVWISDVHLGTAGCQAGLLSDFLHSVECETLYLVGDFAVERQKFFSFKDPLLAGLFFGSCLAHFQTKLRMNAIGFSPSKAVLQHPWLQQLAALPCAYANWLATRRAAALP